jgi:hypothetical protein
MSTQTEAPVRPDEDALRLHHFYPKRDEHGNLLVFLTRGIIDDADLTYLVRWSRNHDESTLARLWICLDERGLGIPFDHVSVLFDAGFRQVSAPSLVPDSPSCFKKLRFSIWSVEPTAERHWMCVPAETIEYECYYYTDSDGPKPKQCCIEGYVPFGDDLLQTVAARVAPDALQNMRCSCVRVTMHAERVHHSRENSESGGPETSSVESATTLGPI